MGGEPVEGRPVVVAAGDVGGARGDTLPYLGVELAPGKLLDRRGGQGAELRVGNRLAAEPHEKEIGREQIVVAQVVNGGNQLARCEVARGAENHDHGRRGPAMLAESLQERMSFGVGHGRRIANLPSFCKHLQTPPAPISAPAKVMPVVLDHPDITRPVDARRFNIRGWVWLGEAQSTLAVVEAWSGDVRLGQTEALEPRSDVTAAQGLPAGSPTAFDFFTDRAVSRSDGEFDLHLRLRMRDGTRTEPLCARRLKIAAAGQPEVWKDRPDRSRGGRRQFRFAAPGSSANPPSRGRLGAEVLH